jgi:uncharacterized membrane protein YcaP (DUF421 family)
MQLPDWHALWVNLIQLGTGEMAISLLEKILRPVAVYLFLVFMLRAYGKRILAQLNPFDLVVLLTLSNTVQNAIIGNDTSLLGGIVGAVSLVAVNAVLIRTHYRGPKMEHGIGGEDDICLIRNHELQEDALRKLYINIGELTAKAHERGFDDLLDVETAVLYPNGTIQMKGEAVRETERLDEILSQLQALRREVAIARG